MHEEEVTLVNNHSFLKKILKHSGCDRKHYFSQITCFSLWVVMITHQLLSVL